MPFKRPLDAFDSLVSSTPPRGPKRRALSSVPSSSPWNTHASSSSFTTPRTIRIWKVPSDSPSNPFGRISRRAKRTSLPTSTSFSKHVALRMQLVCPKADPRQRASAGREGVFRIVQVPLSYTLAHLRRVINFVFDPASKDHMMDSAYNLRRASRGPVDLTHFLNKDQGKSKGKGKGKSTLLDVDDEDDNRHTPTGHLFEVMKHVIMHSPLTRPGEIRSGTMRRKASSARDPYHYAILPDDEDALRRGHKDGASSCWVAEEDFTVHNVWPAPGDSGTSYGIIYHVSPHAQIHITLNTKRIQPRKGASNKPYVFQAWGALDVTHPDPLSPSNLSAGRVNQLRWNGHNTFERFLEAEVEAQRQSGVLPSEEEDEDELEEDELATDPDLSSGTLPWLSSPSSTPLITPLPTSALCRRRVDFANERMVKLTKAGMHDLEDDDESADKDRTDELAEDDDDDYGRDAKRVVPKRAQSVEVGDWYDGPLDDEEEEEEEYCRPYDPSKWSVEV